MAAKDGQPVQVSITPSRAMCGSDDGPQHGDRDWVNGTPPPEVPIADIELGVPWISGHLMTTFAALATFAPRGAIRSEPPGFVAAMGIGRLPSTTMSTPAKHPAIFSSYPNITINDQTSELAEFRLDDRARRSAPSAAGY